MQWFELLICNPFGELEYELCFGQDGLEEFKIELMSAVGYSILRVLELP